MKRKNVLTVPLSTYVLIVVLHTSLPCILPLNDAAVQILPCPSSPQVAPCYCIFPVFRGIAILAGDGKLHKTFHTLNIDPSNLLPFPLLKPLTTSISQRQLPQALPRHKRTLWAIPFLKSLGVCSLTGAPDPGPLAIFTLWLLAVAELKHVVGINCASL